MDGPSLREHLTLPNSQKICGGGGGGIKFGRLALTLLLHNLAVGYYSMLACAVYMS